MGTMLVLVLTTGVTFLATFSPPGSVAATAEGYLYPSSSPLPPGISTTQPPSNGGNTRVPSLFLPTSSPLISSPSSSASGDPYHNHRPYILSTLSSKISNPLDYNQKHNLVEDEQKMKGPPDAEPAVVPVSSASFAAPSSAASISMGAIASSGGAVAKDLDEIDSSHEHHFSTGLPSKHNWTEEEILAKELSKIPTRDTLTVAIPMTVVYVVILLSGLLGNISTCIVIAKNTYMHTATNYYLFSLAMSDLLLLVCGLPQEIYHIWKKYPYLFGNTFCIIRGLAAETSANATVLTITAFTVERFVAIVYPLKSHKISQLSRVVRMIGIIWILAFCLALPQAAQFGVLDEKSPSLPGVVLVKGAWCTIVREIFPYAFEISSCVFFVIPMTIITVLYVLIGLKLRRPRGGSGSNSQELNVEPRNLSTRHSQSHVIRMLVAVVVAFFICWAPFHAQRFMALYGRHYELEGHDLYRTIYQGVHYISGILYYISTCINPILYHIMSNKFRQAFKDTASRLCGKSNSRLHHRTYSAISHRSSRMGVRGHHQFNSVRKSTVETDMCFKCRRNATICTCKGSLSNNHAGNHYNHNNHHLNNLHHYHPHHQNNHKNKLNNLKSFGMDQAGSECTSLALLNTSPSEKDVVIAMTAMEKSQGPLCPSPKPNHQLNDCNSNQSTPSPPKSLAPPPPSPPPATGLRALLSRAGKKSNTTNNNANGTSHHPLQSQSHPSQFSSNSSHPLQNGMKPEKRRRWGLSSKNNKPGAGHHPLNYLGLGARRPPSDPALQSTFAVTLLDGKGNSKTAVLRPRTSSTGGSNAAVILATYKNSGRATSYSSVDSGKSNNTISNSSLQDMDESEYTGEELAGYMAELNHSLESPNKM